MSGQDSSPKMNESGMDGEMYADPLLRFVGHCRADTHAHAVETRNRVQQNRSRGLWYGLGQGGWARSVGPLKGPRDTKFRYTSTAFSFFSKIFLFLCLFFWRRPLPQPHKGFDSHAANPGPELVIILPWLAGDLPYPGNRTEPNRTKPSRAGEILGCTLFPATPSAPWLVLLDYGFIGGSCRRMIKHEDPPPALGGAFRGSSRLSVALSSVAAETCRRRGRPLWRDGGVIEHGRRAADDASWDLARGRRDPSPVERESGGSPERGLG